MSFGLSFERCACESFGLCVTMGLLLLLSSADSWQLDKGDGSLLSTMALSRRESISPSAKHKAAQQVRKQSLKQSNRSQIERHTLSEGIAVVDEFLCNTSGELMGNFFQTLTGREHTLCQGTTLVLTYNTIQYTKTIKTTFFTYSIKAYIKNTDPTCNYHTGLCFLSWSSDNDDHIVGIFKPSFH